MNNTNTINDNINNILTTTNINKVIKLANYLNSNDKEFFSSKYKAYRKALHPLVLSYRKANNITTKSINTTSTTSLSNQITDAFRNRLWSDALVLLRTMRCSSNKDDMPKLGALQRWVRDCDVANRLNNNDNSSSSYTSNSNSDSNTNISILLLDAVLRVMINKQHLLMSTTNTTNTTNTTTNKNLTSGNIDSTNSSNCSNSSLDDTTIMDTKATIIRHTPFKAPSYTNNDDDDAITINNDTSGKLRVVFTCKGIDRRPPSNTDLNIYMTSPNIIDYYPYTTYPTTTTTTTTPPNPTRYDVPNVPGAFIMSMILTPLECKQLIHVAESIGFVPDAVDGIDNIQWLADETLLNPIYERCKDLLPQSINGCKLASVNQRWRLFRYLPGAVYRPHIDGAWPGSGLDKDGNFTDEIFSDRHSKLTFLIYLNGNFDGGTTTFFMPHDNDFTVNAFSVQPLQGSILCFPHGDTPFSLIHEGSEVSEGSPKYVIRSDVLFYI